jgi:hypothetical protein
MDPIDTAYRGDYFRSRTEARWAVFFSTMDIEYEYEPQGYDLDGLYYLPDFWLPGWEMWVEVKGAEDYSYKELKKAHRLSTQSGSPVVMILGRPGIEEEQDRSRFNAVPQSYSIDLFLGPLANRVEHPKIEATTGAISASYQDENALSGMAQYIRKLFMEDVYYDSPDDIPRIRKRFGDILEYSPQYASTLDHYSTVEETWARRMFVRNGFAFYWSDSANTLKVVREKQARFSPATHRLQGKDPDLEVSNDLEGKNRFYKALLKACYVRFEHGESPD